MSVASRDIYTDITEGLFLPQLLHESQFLASAGSSSSLTQSSLDFVPPAFPLYIESTTIQTHCLPSGERGRALSDATVYDRSNRWPVTAKLHSSWLREVTNKVYIDEYSRQVWYLFPYGR
jgi:hypothetical protein